MLTSNFDYLLYDPTIRTHYNQFLNILTYNPSYGLHTMGMEFEKGDKGDMTFSVYPEEDIKYF